MYGSFLSYMGLDTSSDFSKQQYTDNMTWKDYFDQMTVSQITQVKALVDDAAAQGFTYDTAEDMSAFDTELAAQAESESLSQAEVYTSLYGQYATAERIRPFAEENMLATAYFEHLTEINKPCLLYTSLLPHRAVSSIYPISQKYPWQRKSRIRSAKATEGKRSVFPSRKNKAPAWYRSHRR